MDTVAKTAQLLKNEKFERTALIGFAGAPWTVACYMVDGGPSKDFIHVKSWAYREPESFGKLIDTLTDATVKYLSMQIEAGAEAVQLFDSWAGILDEPLFRKWVIAPTGVIARKLRAAYPHVPLIGFPRGAGRLYQDYAQNADVAAIGLDQQVPLKWAATLQAIRPVQGNLDPVCLLAGGDALYLAAEQILGALWAGPFVFNLGHGVLKETPPENVAQLAEMIRGWQA
jgi:uroporphyrinogen decarboxylase